MSITELELTLYILLLSQSIGINFSAELLGDFVKCSSTLIVGRQRVEKKIDF